MLRLACKIVVALAVFAGCIALGALARNDAPSFQKCQSAEYGTNHASKNEPEDSATLVQRIFAFSCTARFLEAHNAVITAISTVLLTLVTAGLVWVGYRQIRTTRAQLRAYVFPGEALLIDEPTKGLIATVQIKNGGQTPAYETMILRSAKTIWAKEVRDFPDPTPTPRTSKMDLGMDSIAQTQILLDDILNTNGRDALRKGDLELFLWGLITYRDIFGREQTTRFRFVMGGKHGWPGDNRFLVCEDGNKAT